MRVFSAVKNGSSGTDTVVCQAFLRALQYVGKDGRPLDVDGVAGMNTVYAINCFQATRRKFGYECGTNGKNDGVFGAACWKRILGV